MATKITFNQDVKHGSITYHTGDTLTVDDALAAYFGAQGWLEGVEATATPDNPVRLDINSGRGVEIVPEFPYENDKPLPVIDKQAAKLEVANARHGMKDTNNG